MNKEERAIAAKATAETRISAAIAAALQSLPGSGVWPCGISVRPTTIRRYDGRAPHQLAIGAEVSIDVLPKVIDGPPTALPNGPKTGVE